MNIEDIKRDTRVELLDGAQGVVKGSYLSADGFMLRVQVSDGIVTRNVRLKDVIAVLAPEREGE